MLGLASRTMFEVIKSFRLKSGTNASIAVFGFPVTSCPNSLLPQSVLAPPSAVESSRATEVSTQCFKPILATASATLGGSAMVEFRWVCQFERHKRNMPTRTNISEKSLRCASTLLTSILPYLDIVHSGIRCESWFSST